MYRTILFLLALALALPPFCFAGEGGVALDKVDVSISAVHLQRGARTFINYCLKCHSASGFRYAGLQKIGLKKEEVLAYLAPGKKISDFLISSMPSSDAKKWFGVVPPDLSWEARSMGADWIYTYLKSFYRDNDRPNGWNNVVFPGANMPNVLYDLEGVRSVSFEEIRVAHDDSGKMIGHEKVVDVYPGDGSHSKSVQNLSGSGHFPSSRIVWGDPSGGIVDPVVYDRIVTDLVSFMAYMAEPNIKERESIGFFFVTWLLILSGLLYLLKADFWKDVD